MNTTITKPTYTPNHWEIEHGYFKDGVFYRPDFCILKNGEFIEVNGGTVNAYPYNQAFHIMLHLQAVNPSDNFTIEPSSWRSMESYNMVLDSELEYQKGFTEEQ